MVVQFRSIIQNQNKKKLVSQPKSHKKFINSIKSQHQLTTKMRKHRSLHNLDTQNPPIQRHILLPNLSSQHTQQIHINYMLSAATQQSNPLAVMKIRKNNSLSQLESSILKLNIQNSKLKNHLFAIKKQKTPSKLMTQPQQDKSQMLDQLKKRLTSENKDKYFLNSTIGVKKQQSFNKRYHSEGKYEDNIEQMPSKKPKKLKGFNKCRARSVDQLSKPSDNVEKNSSPLYNHLQNQNSSSQQKPSKELKLNLRKQLNLLKIPDNKKPLKLSNPSQFKSLIPKDGGYQYIQSPFDKYESQKNLLEDKVKVQTTVSKHGVMVKEQDDTRFYTNTQYESYLKKIQRLSGIQFYRDFLQIKCFKRWKIHVFSRRFLITRQMIKQLIPNIYPQELLQTRKIFDKITEYKYIMLSRESPLEYEKYLLFLHDSSYPVLKRVTENHYMQLIRLMLEPIKEKVVAMEGLSEKHQKLIERHKKPYKLSNKANFLHLTSLVSEQSQLVQIMQNFQRTFQFKNEFLCIEGLIKRIFYSFNNYHIEWTANIYREIITKLKAPLTNYKKYRQKIHGNLNNLFNVKNHDEYRYEKTESYEMQIRLIEYSCRFVEGSGRAEWGQDLIWEKLNTLENSSNQLTLKQQRLYIPLRQTSILELFQQFASHLISRLSPTNLLTYYRNHYAVEHRMGKAQTALPTEQQLQIDILQMVLEKIDVYTSTSIINSSPDMRYDQKFRQELQQIVLSNVQEANEIVDVLNTLIEDVMEFFNSQDRKQSYILSYTIMEETREKITLIPDDIHVGLFVINILEVKNYLKDFINHELQELTKDLPEEFKSSYNAFFQKLLNYTNKINLSVWTIEDFVTSFQHKEMYEEYREDEIFKDQQKIKNILSAVNKTLPKTYEQCYVLFLKLKDMIQKIQTKVQTFDLNCIKKLKFFGNQIDDLAESIWKELVRVRNRILEVDNFVERQTFIEDILVELPKFQAELKKIKKSIERLSYIETLQIRFNLKENLTKDFNLYEKSESDLRLLQSLLRKLLIFQKSYNLELRHSITVVNAQTLLEQINSNKSEIKISERYIISYQKILMKIYQLYDYYKIVLQTADELGRLQNDDICEIIRLVMVDNQAKEDTGALANNKPKDKSLNINTVTVAKQTIPNSKQQQPGAMLSSSVLNSHQLSYFLNSLCILLKKDPNLLTLQQTINLKLYLRYDQIHYQILKKEKKKKMELIINHIETDMNDIILEVCNLQKSLFGNTEDHLSSVVLIGGRGFREAKGEGEKKGSIGSRTNSIVSEDVGEQMVVNQTKQKQQINLHSGFVNLKQSIKFIEQILNELKNIILSPFLEDEKNLLLQKIQYVASNLDILNLLLSAQTKVQKLIEDNILTEAVKEIEKDWSSRHSICDSRLGKASKEISFDNKLEKDVINAWYFLLKRLSNKKVSQISLCFREQSNDLENFMGRLNSFEKIVNIKIQQKKTIFPLLYFFNNSEILKFVLNPESFVSHMYPCQKFERRQKKRYNLTTLYGEEIDIQLQQEPSLTIKSIYEEIKAVIGSLFRENIGQQPIDLLSHYSKQRTPLQIVFVLDQLYLQSKFITETTLVSSNTNREQTITSLMGQIKGMSKNMDDPVEIQAFQYKNLMAEMLICARIDYRNRLEVNFVENYWLQELLVYCLDSYNTLYFKNLNHMLEIKYSLVNAMHLISLFPGSERNFVKMCQAFSGEISAIHVGELEMLRSLSAKLMYPLIEHEFYKKIPQDVCRGVVLNYPLCFLAKLETISYEVLSKLIRCIEKVRHQLLKERQQKGGTTHIQNSYFTNSSDAACIFLMFDKPPQKQPISYKLKAMFRSLNRITPSYELVFLCKLLRAQMDSNNPEILDCLYIVNGYFYLYREILAHNPSFSFVNKLLSKLAKELIGKKQAQYREIVHEFFLEYFVNLGVDKNTIENFLSSAKTLEHSKASNNMRQSRVNKQHNKKFQFIFKILVYAQKEQPQAISSFPTSGGYSDTLGKTWNSTYELKEKIDSFIESVKDSSNGCIPDTILNMLQEMIRIVAGSISKSQRTKPIFIFGEYRTGKTLIVKLLTQFFQKLFQKKDINVDIMHESEIPKNFTRIKDMQKKIGLLKLIFEGETLQRAKNSFVFLQVSSSSNQNGFLDTFLNMFDDQTSTKQINKQSILTQRSKKSQVLYILEIKKMVHISPNIFLNTFKFYLPQNLSMIENITKKWSKDFVSRYQIKEKDELYYMVLNSHTVGLRMVMSVFESLVFTNGNGVEWLVQPVLENVVTTVTKFVDAFLMDVTNIEILFKGMEGENQGTSKSFTQSSMNALPLLGQQSSKQKEHQFLKLLAYCAFWALAFLSEQSSYQQIQKIVKQHYYRLAPECLKTKDNFLYKILLIENNQISFNFLKCLENDIQMTEDTGLKYTGSAGALIVETLNMKVFGMFCGKLHRLGMRKGNSNNLLVIGREEVGKSSYLKNYLTENHNDMYIRVKSHDQSALEKFLKQLTQLKYKQPRNIRSRLPTQQSNSINRSLSSKSPEDSVLVWVENVAFYHETSETQKYMKFLSEHKKYRIRNPQVDSYFINKSIKNFTYFTERRYAEKDFLYENWNLTVIAVSFLEHQIQTIFTDLIAKKLNIYILDPTILQDIKNKIPVMVNHHLTLLKFCRENTKPSLSNWTIDIGYNKYRHVTDEFFSQQKYSFLAGLNADDIVKRLNLNLFFTLFCCMRNKKDLELFENRVSKFLDLDYKEVEGYLMDEEGEIKNAKNLKDEIANMNELPIDDSNNSLAKLSLKLKDNRFFNNILVHPTFCRNFQIVSFALKNKSHLMVNKKFISRDFSFIEMVLQTQGKDWGKLDLVRSYEQLKQSISKLAENVSVNEEELEDKKGKNEGKKFGQHGALGKREFYLYAPYQIIKINPRILDYIVEYIEECRVFQEEEQMAVQSQQPWLLRRKKAKEENQKDQNTRGFLSSPNVTFVIEYSLFELGLINNYLLTQLPKICNVLWLTAPPIAQYEDVGFDILVKKFPDQQNETLKQIAKTLHMVFSQIYNTPLTDVSYEKTKFVQQYNYHVRNYGQFVYIVGELYFLRLRFAQLKKNSLELTLSEIDKLLREYRVLKKEESICLTSTKTIKAAIDAAETWLKSAKKKIDSMIVFSVEKGIQKYKDNIQSITDQITKLTDNERRLARMSKHLISLISRNQLAEMKYIFVNNFVSMKSLFECICLVLRENTDYGSMKKCFTDLNLVNRLKDVDLEKVPFETMLEIKEKINEIVAQTKSFSTISNKTVFEWLRCSVDLVITRNEMMGRLPKLEKEKEELQIELHRLIETNEMDSLELEIQQKQGQLVRDKQSLKEAEDKLKGITELLIDLEKFEEFLELKKHCEEESKWLSEIVKDFLSYSIMEGVELVYFNIYSEQEKKKLRGSFGNFMKRKFGFIPSKEKQQAFDKFQQDQSNIHGESSQSSTCPPILELKYDYPMEITKSIRYLNQLLSKNKQTLMILDPYNSFTNAIKMRPDILLVSLKKFFKKKFNYTDYRLIIIQLEDDEWNVSLKELAKNSKNQRKILQYHKKRIMLPSELNLIFIKKNFCSSLILGQRQYSRSSGIDQPIHHQSTSNEPTPQIQSPHAQPFTEMMFAFRIFNFEVSESDYYLLIKMIIIQELIKAKEHSSLQMIINKQEIIRKSFMGVLYFFCKKTNQFNIGNVKLLRQTISMIEMWKITLIETRGFQYEVFEEKNQKDQIKKIYRILSKMFKLVEMYFSRDSQYLNFDYFITTLTRGAIYGIYNFGDEKYFILQYVISMIVYSLDSKNEFLSMFFMKIYSIEENICTQMESDNLTFVMSEFDRLEGFVVEKIQKGTYNYFKHLPYQNKHLENCYTKILAAQKIANNLLSHQQVNEIIESFQNLSFFKKLVIKRILAPPIFEQEMVESINILSEIIIKNNDNFIKKFFRNGLLFCQCDIYFWKKNIKLKYKYEEVTLTDLTRIKNRSERVNLLIIDDLESDREQNSANSSEKGQNSDKIQSSDRRDQLLQQLISMEHENSIFFSHQPLNEQMKKHFKSIPFLLFLELYCFVNIDSHDKETLLEQRKNRHSVQRNTQISEMIGREMGENALKGYNGKEVQGKERDSMITKQREKTPRSNPQQNNTQPFSKKSNTQIQNTPSSNPGQESSYKNFTNKEIKRHYYSVISQKSTEQRSIAIIRFSNHIPFLLKNQKNQSKILIYYYWKFLIWYESDQKIVFESIKEKILKKNNQLANKLQHYQENKEILKAINILAPQKLRSENEEILRIFKEYYAVLTNYIDRQPVIEAYESDTQRNVFINESTSYQKNIHSMLSNIKDVSNILIGKNSLDPQRVSDYFYKKATYSLTDINSNLLKLCKHREQVNEENTLTHLNIELIQEPANILALFSKPGYKIIVLGKNGGNELGKSDQTKDQIAINDFSNQTISEFLDKEDEEKLASNQEPQDEVDQGKQSAVDQEGQESEKALKDQGQASKKSIKVERQLLKSKHELKILPSEEKGEGALRLDKNPLQMRDQSDLQKSRKSGKNQLFIKKSSSKEVEQAEKKLQKRLSIQVVKSSNTEKELNKEGTSDPFGKIFGKILAGDKKPNQKITVDSPSSIANMNILKKRKNAKLVTLHKIYIYNQYRILFKPIDKKQFDRLSSTTMFRLNLFHGFGLKLFYQKEQTLTNKNISTYGSFSLGSDGLSGIQLTSKSNVINHIFIKTDKFDTPVTGQFNGKETVSNVLMRDALQEKQVINEEKSGGGESLIKIGSKVDMGIAEQAQDQGKSGGGLKSQGKISWRGSGEQRSEYKAEGGDRYLTQLKEKKSFDQFKLKRSSVKKLQLGSAFPSPMSSFFGSLICNEGQDDDQVVKKPNEND